jgi:hypothetical protein
MPEVGSTNNSLYAMYTKHMSDSGKCPTSHYDSKKHMKVCRSIISAKWQEITNLEMTRYACHSHGRHEMS